MSMRVLGRGMTQPGPVPVEAVAHLLMGAASGFLAGIGFRYLLVRWTEGGVNQACRTVPEPTPR